MNNVKETAKIIKRVGNGKYDAFEVITKTEEDNVQLLINLTALGSEIEDQLTLDFNFDEKCVRLTRVEPSTPEEKTKWVCLEYDYFNKTLLGAYVKHFCKNDPEKLKDIEYIENHMIQ